MAIEVEERKVAVEGEELASLLLGLDNNKPFSPIHIFEYPEVSFLFFGSYCELH